MRSLQLPLDKITLSREYLKSIFLKIFNKFLGEEPPNQYLTFSPNRSFSEEENFDW